MIPRAPVRVQGAVLALLACALPALAVHPTDDHKREAARFKTAAHMAARPAADRTLAAVRAFQGGHPQAEVQLGRRGVASILSGFKAPAKGAPEAAARAFLRAQADLLGVRDEELVLSRKHAVDGAHHLLFDQVRGGVPVEGARVGVHINARGEVHHVTSGFEPEFPALAARVAEGAARGAAAADLGAPLSKPGTLVWFPEPSSGDLRLAWKFRETSRKPRGLWVSYVDASDGRVLFRYDDLRYAGCLSSGTVRAEVFPLSPIGQDPVTVALPNLYVQVGETSISSTVVTNASGEYCSGLPGWAMMNLRGRYAVVANDDYPNAAYDNGDGRWFQIATPVSSDSPYAANADKTVTISGPVNALKMRTVFSSFEVGVNTDDDYDNDRVQLRDSQDRLLANYLGSKGSFESNEAIGRTLKLRLLSNSDRQGAGWAVQVSSYFVFNNPLVGIAPPAMTSPDRASYDVIFGSTTSSDRRGLYSYADEANVYYHMNAMRDFFVSLNPGSPIAVSSPIVAMTHAGVNFLNAFYDPDVDSLFFGDGLRNYCSKVVGLPPFFDCSFALDATVVRHEYTHLAVERIYPILNYGQGGAISEAVADYLSLTTLGTSKMGEFANAGDTAFRNLNDGIDDGSRCTPSKCRKFSDGWFGEIHEDAIPLGQALWSMRQSLPGGVSRANSLVYGALFYFPSSFMEMRAAILDLADNVTEDALISTIFAEHGISTSAYASGDAQEPNDGTLSATDASGTTAFQGSIRPRGDEDFFSFPAGPGKVRATLTLPLNDVNTPGEYLGFGMSLVDSRNKLLKRAEPVFSNATGGGGCPDPQTGGGNCLTGSTQVTLEYENDSSRILFLGVSCGWTDFDSQGLCDSSGVYSLSLDYSPAGAVTGSVMTASFDNDEFKFSVPVLSYSGGAVHGFSHALLRDHFGKQLAETDSRSGSLALTVASTTTATGPMTGRLKLAPGFAARYPSVGSVHLEVFGRNKTGAVSSLGVSSPIGLTASGAEFKAWNNLMNPMKGEQATLKWGQTSPGNVTLKIFTLKGELVRTLFRGPSTGGGSVAWDGRNDHGTLVASGVYLAHIEGPGLNKTQKIVLIK